jgi:hypothetical protein
MLVRGRPPVEVPVVQDYRERTMAVASPDPLVNR